MVISQSNMIKNNLTLLIKVEYGLLGKNKKSMLLHVKDKEHIK
jgi:hypothetical protein